MQEYQEVATEKQIRTIIGMCERLEVDVPELLEEFSKSEASDFITGLQQKRSNRNTVRIIDGNKKPDYKKEVRLGLAVKLVYQKWTYQQKHVLIDTDEFKREVDALYNIIEDMEVN